MAHGRVRTIGVAFKPDHLASQTQILEIRTFAAFARPDWEAWKGAGYPVLSAQRLERRLAFGRPCAAPALPGAASSEAFAARHRLFEAFAETLPPWKALGRPALQTPPFRRPLPRRRLLGRHLDALRCTASLEAFAETLLPCEALGRPALRRRRLLGRPSLCPPLEGTCAGAASLEAFCRLLAAGLSRGHLVVQQFCF